MAPASVTVNTALTVPDAGFVTVGSVIENAGAATALVIVPMPCTVAGWALVGLDRFMK